MVDLGRDGRNYAFDIVQHVVVPKPNHLITMGVQGSGAFRIRLDGARMLSTVDLDDQLVRRYGEIRDVASDRMLPPYLDGLGHGYCEDSDS